MAQQTEIFEAKIGGGGANTSQNKQMVASTSPGEQVEVILTLRTNGNVRVTVGDGSSNSTGIALNLDTPLLIRVGDSQRLWVTTDDITNQLSIDVIKMPVSAVQEMINALRDMRRSLQPMTPEAQYCPPKVRR